MAIWPFSRQQNLPILFCYICEKAVVVFFFLMKRTDLTGHTFCHLLLPFSPAWNVGIMSRAEQPSCDYGDGGVGTRPQVASLNNCRPLDSLCPEKWEKWVRCHSWVSWGMQPNAFPALGRKELCMLERACLSHWKLRACFILCLEPLLILCSLGLVLTPAQVALRSFVN